MGLLSGRGGRHWYRLTLYDVLVSEVLADNLEGILFGAKTGNKLLPVRYPSAVEIGDGNREVFLSL